MAGTERMSLEAYRALTGTDKGSGQADGQPAAFARLPAGALKTDQNNEAPKGNKHKAKPKVVDGIRFHSTWEAQRYIDLSWELKLGQISDLELQKTFPLEVNGVHICDYIADFVYMRDGRQIVEDAKGRRLPEYKLKYNLMLAVYGIEILETYREKKK